MAWIETVPDEDARGVLKRIYDDSYERSGKVWNIVRLSSLRPNVTRDSLGLYTSIMFGRSELSRAEREMIAVVVSRANDCHY